MSNKGYTVETYIIKTEKINNKYYIKKYIEIWQNQHY